MYTIIIALHISAIVLLLNYQEFPLYVISVKISSYSIKIFYMHDTKMAPKRMYFEI